MGPGVGGSDGARMRFNPEASWGANAGLDIPRKALEDVKVCTILDCVILYANILDCVWYIYMQTFAKSHVSSSFIISQAKHPEISYADLYTLAGVVAVEEAG